MPGYLEEAAAQLRLAIKSAEATYGVNSGALAEERKEIARQFAMLAAIEKGILPAEIVTDWAEGDRL